MFFTNKVVIITGAASGIGAAISLSFAKQHASLLITDKNETDLRKIREESQKLTKNKVFEVVADVRKDEELDNIVKCALKEYGKIDVLVNCAGIYEATNLKDFDIIEKFDRIIAVNLRSVVAMTTKALPALIENKGCIINISSVSSTITINNGIIYSMSKAGVTQFTKSAAVELARLGVRVNCISPGPVKTNIVKNAGLSEAENNTFWDDCAAQVPLKKCVKAEEVAELVVYLASDIATSITGSDFVVDAGMMLGPGK